MPRGDRLALEGDVANGEMEEMARAVPEIAGSVAFYNGAMRQRGVDVREAFKTNPSG